MEIVAVIGPDWMPRESYAQMGQFYHNESHSSLGLPTSDRRIGIRFPIEMDLSYRVGAKSVEWVPGKTVNISSSGVLIRTDSIPSRGSKVHVALAWPKMLDNRIPLRLMVHGHVVRAVNGEVAVTFQRFEFRTAREPGRVEMEDGAAAERA